MAYEKNNWQTGDIVTSAKLNHMEDGIASSGVMVVNSTYDESTDLQILNKTWQEIYDAMHNDILCVYFYEEESVSIAFYAIVYVVQDSPSEYKVVAINEASNPSEEIFIATSPDDYPAHTFD